MIKSAHLETAAGNPGCLVRSLTAAFLADPALEAVTIDKAKNKISVATLGKTDEARLAERVTSTVEKAQIDFPCGLIAGTEDCGICSIPLTPDERQAVTVKREGDTTTIARVTCPTAPKFWRWREM